MMLPDPIIHRHYIDTTTTTTYWGELGGRRLDFNSNEDRVAACRWYIDQVRARGAQGDYKYIDLAGFYWIREIAAQLGATDTVTSPTFAIVNQYKGKGNRRIHHFDFYRINDIREAYDFGYEEYFFSGDLCLVEWPEKIEQLLPENVMTVRITVDSDTARTFEID